MFTDEIHPFSLTKSTKTFHLQCTSPSLDEHVILIGRSEVNNIASELFINQPDAM